MTTAGRRRSGITDRQQPDRRMNDLCSKCHHPRSEHDIIDGCKHTQRVTFSGSFFKWPRKQTCICSDFERDTGCPCETCDKHRHRND
jgi:hypothetical protein